MIIVSSAFQAELDDAQDRTIRSKIETYATKMCTPTVGIPFVLYEWDNYPATPNWGSLTQRLPATDTYGVVPNLSLNWAYSSPFYLNLPYYAVEFYGFFHAEETSSDFGFYAFGDNVEVELEFDSTTHITSGTELVHQPRAFASSSTGDSVTANNWYAFKFRVWGETGGRYNGVVLKYTYDLSAVDEDEFYSSDLEVVNCGVVNITGSELSPTTVTHFNDVQGSRKRNEPTEYSFTVPLGDETGAYIRNSINEYVNGSITLHEGRLIKIWAGYDCDATPAQAETEGVVVGNVEYIPRFTGFIYGFEANRNSDTLTVKCKDFFSRAEEVFCVNYPEPCSYWGAGYLVEGKSGEPNGLGMPIAYDKWNVVGAIKDLFIKAGIPTSLFKDTERARATSGDVLVTDVDSVYDANYNLSWAQYYGTDQVEEYINRFDTGTTVFEAVMKIVDTYGYNIEFKPSGYLRFFPQNNPTSDSVDNAQIDSRSHDDIAGDGIEVPGIPAARGGGYTYATGDGNEVSFGVDGSGIAGDGFALIVVRDTNSGASDNSNQYWSGTASATVTIRIHPGGSIVYTDTFNFYMSEEWYYNQGIYPALGHNPCYIPLTRSLPRDNYDIHIEVEDSGAAGYQIKIDELWAYTGNVSTDVVKTLQTFKATGIIASLSSVDYERSMDDLRNDILVVGQRKGIWVADGSTEVGVDDPEFSADHNNQFVNYHSRAVDVESIYNPAAANYTGRHLMTYIQEPSINTYERADWLSFSMLDAYRAYKNKVNFSLIGDPEVYINDPIAVKDKVEEDGLNTVWVEGFSETITKTSWDIRMDVVGHSPFPSYTEDQDYEIPEFNDGYFAELTITDNFGNKRDGTMRSGIGSAQAWGANPVTVANATGWDDSGTIVVYRADIARSYGVFTYTSRSGNQLNGVVWRFTPSEVLGRDGSPTMFSMDAANIYNAYEESDYGGFVTVSFRCLVTGRISVGVKDNDHGIFNFIAGLSGGGGLDDRGIPKQQTVFPGEVIELIWGGIDETGVTHTAVPEAEETGSGWFTQDGKYYFTLDYTRESDGHRTNLNSLQYNDEDGNPQSKYVEIVRSMQDEHLLSYTFRLDDGTDNSRTGNNTYAPNTDGYVYTCTGNNEGSDGRVARQYMWISTDGNIHVNLKSFYLDTSRVYYVTYSVEGISMDYTHLTGYSFDDFGNPWGRLTRSMPVKDAELAGGTIKWDNTAGHTFQFNPDWNDFGAFFFDGQWNKFYEENSTYQNKAAAYWIRLILDIRDGSGRRIKYRTPTFVNHRLPSNQGDMWSQTQYAYSLPNWDTVLELMQVPITIDDESVGSFGHHWRMNERYNSNQAHWVTVPEFEPLQVGIPVCWTIGPSV